MKQKFAIGTSTLLLLSLVFGSSFVSAKTQTPGDNHIKNKKIVKTLKAEEGSQVLLDKAEIYTVDGKEYVGIGKNRKADGKLEAFEVIVDKQKGTYKTVAVEKPVFKAEPQPPAPSSGTVTPQYAYRTYSGHVVADTVDPVNIMCTQTILGITWDVDLDNNTQRRDRSLSTWAGNPTDAGTHWFNTYAYYNTPDTVNLGTSIYQTASTGFYNEDFPFLYNDGYRTYADVYTSVTGYPNGTFDYYASQSTSGEGSSLLRLRYCSY